MVADEQGNYSATLLTLLDGRHAITVTVTDAAGNRSEPSAPLVVVIDTTPPVSPPVPIVSPTSATQDGNLTTNEQVITVTGSGEPGSNVTVYVDGVVVATGVVAPDGTYAITLPPLTEGGHEIRVFVTDRAGNQSQPSAPIQVSIDVTAPDTLISAGPSGDRNSNSVTFFFDSPNGGARFECSLDGASFAPCRSPKDYVQLSEGEHVFRVRAIDVASNIDPSPSSRIFSVNSRLNERIIQTAPPRGVVTTGRSTTPIDPVETILRTPKGGQVSLAEVPVEVTSPPGFTFFGLQVDIEAEPADSPEDPIELTFLLNYDSLPAGTALADIYVFRNGALVRECTGPPGVASPDPCLASRSFTQDGDVQVVALTTRPSSWNFGISAGGGGSGGTALTAPVFKTPSPSSPANVRTIALTGYAPDTSVVQIYEDAGCTGRVIASGLASLFRSTGIEVTIKKNSLNTFYAQAELNGVLSGCSESSVSFVEDSDAPPRPGAPRLVPTSDTGASNTDNITKDTSPTIFGSSQPGARVDIYVDDVAAATATVDTDGTYVATLPRLGEGHRSIRVVATDAADNPSLPSPELELTIDTLAPLITLTTAPRTPTLDDTPTFWFEVSEDAAAQCRLSGQGFEACSSPITYPQSPDGIYTFDVRATDVAGNRGDTATYTFRIETNRNPVDEEPSDGTDPGNDSKPPALEAYASVSRRYVSPNNDHRADSTAIKLTFPVELHWTARFISADGETVAIRRGVGMAPTVEWPAGHEAEGWYTWLITASNSRGQYIVPVTGTLKVDLTKPRIRRIRIRTLGKTVNINVLVSEPAKVIVVVRKNGRGIARVPADQLTSRKHRAKWRPKVRAGRYRVWIRANDRALNRRLRKGPSIQIRRS